MTSCLFIIDVSNFYDCSLQDYRYLWLSLYMRYIRGMYSSHSSMYSVVSYMKGQPLVVASAIVCFFSMQSAPHPLIKCVPEINKKSLKVYCLLSQGNCKPTHTVKYY